MYAQQRNLRARDTLRLHNSNYNLCDLHAYISSVEDITDKYSSFR